MSNREKGSLAAWFQVRLSLQEPPSEEVVLSERWGVERCALCGRTILLGEKLERLRRDGQVFTLCSLCNESWPTKRLVRVA